MGANSNSGSATFSNPFTSLNGLRNDVATIAPAAIAGPIGAALGTKDAKETLNNIDGKTAADQAKAQTQAVETAENSLVQQQQDALNQQSSSAAAVAARNSARQAQLTAAANFSGYSGTILTSPLGASGGSSSNSKTILGS